MSDNKKRYPGFYRVKDDGRWIIAEFTTPEGCLSHWLLPGYELRVMDSELEEINERQINPDPATDDLPF